MGFKYENSKNVKQLSKKVENKKQPPDGFS